MKIKIICGFKSKQSKYKEIENNFIKRAKPVFPIQIQEYQLNNKADENSLKKLQTTELLSKTSERAKIVVLSEHAKHLDSKEFSAMLENYQNNTQQLEFIIGSPYGLDLEQCKQVSTILSISKMTFTSELCRLLLLEQIYRSTCIIKGLPYHKD